MRYAVAPHGGVRYVTNHGNEFFGDDGKFSKQRPSDMCFYHNYTLIDLEEYGHFIMGVPLEDILKNRQKAHNQ